MRYKVKTAPTQYPATLADVKRNLRIDTTDTDTDRDQLLNDLISDATAASQNATGRQYCRATYTLYLDAYPVSNEIAITMGPVAAINSVKYLKQGETVLTTVDPSKYQLDNVELTARLRFLESFSVDADKMNVIEIEVVNGWDNVADDSATTASPTTTSDGTTTAAPTTTEAPSIGTIPVDLKQAVILRACEGYLNPDNDDQHQGSSLKLRSAELKERNYKVPRY